MIIKEIKRFTVKNVNKDINKGIQYLELDNGQSIELRQSWFNSCIEIGDSIAIKTIDNSDRNQNVISITDSNGFIVLNPDHLVTSTDLSAASFCQRKIWLNSRFKVQIGAKKAFVIGNLVHCMFQETLNDDNPSKELLYFKLKMLIKTPSILRQLLQLNLGEQEILKEVNEYIDSVVLFNRKYNSGKASLFDEAQSNLKLKINKVTDIEETILSPDYGLKGKTSSWHKPPC